MKSTCLSVFVVSLLGSGLGLTYAGESLAENDATPTIKERVTEDTIRGPLMRIEGEYYSIKDHIGVEHKIHVDKSTKLDVVRPGDIVRAYVTDEGHATTLERGDMSH